LSVQVGNAGSKNISISVYVDDWIFGYMFVKNVSNKKAHTPLPEEQLVEALYHAMPNTLRTEMVI